MSGSNGQSQRTKREIRRVMGPAAMQTMVDHEDALASLLGTLKAQDWKLTELTHTTARHSSDVAKLQTLANYLGVRIRELDARPTLPDSFWKRLRWLLVGR
jgi:hypothetical protein